MPRGHELAAAAAQGAGREEALAADVPEPVPGLPVQVALPDAGVPLLRGGPRVRRGHLRDLRRGEGRRLPRFTGEPLPL